MTLPGHGVNLSAAVERYVAVMEALTADNLDSLESVLTPEARFVDPFNDVCGIAAVRAVFAHGFEQCPGMRFVVSARAVDGQHALLRWRMTCETGKPGLVVEGMSELTLTADGRVAAHIDYWDPASQLYERVPLLGWLMRRIRRRLAAPGVSAGH